MPDSELEDRVRFSLRAKGDALPMTITPEELERRLALRRRDRLGRRAGAVAAAVAILAIGSLVVTSGRLGLSNVGTGPAPAPTAGVAPSDAVATSEAVTTPSEAAAPCENVDPSQGGQPLTLGMGVSPGDSILHGGVRGGSYGWGNKIVDGYGPGVDPETLDPVNAGPPARHLEVLASDGYACLVGIDADATPIGGGDPLPLLATGSTPRRVSEVSLPPVGEWLVRVRAEFATAPPALAWSETYFRVVVPDPSADWAGDSLPALAAPDGTVLLEDATDFDRPRPWTDKYLLTIAGSIPPRSEYAVDFICLGYLPVNWSIGGAGDNHFGHFASSATTCDGRPVTTVIDGGTPPADLEVIVTGDPGTAWHIVVSTKAERPELIAPSVQMWPTDGPGGMASAAEAFAHCVATPDSTSLCGPSWTTLDDRPNVLVPLGGNATLSLGDGWVIDTARIVAVSADAIGSGADGPEHSVAFIDTPALEQTFAVLLESGEWIVQVAISASKGSETYTADYYLRVAVTP